MRLALVASPCGANSPRPRACSLRASSLGETYFDFQARPAFRSVPWLCLRSLPRSPRKPLEPRLSMPLPANTPYPGRTRQRLQLLRAGRQADSRIRTLGSRASSNRSRQRFSASRHGDDKRRLLPRRIRPRQPPSRFPTFPASSLSAAGRRCITSSTITCAPRP